MPDQNQPERAAAPQGARAPAIDVRKLADKVYQLMLEDLRLEQARGGTSPRRPKAGR